LAEQANRAGLKYVAIDASLYAAEASMKSGGSASSRQELERLLSASDKLTARLLLAKTHVLLAAALRLSGNTGDASREYRDAIRVLNEMSKDAGDKFMDRADMKAMFTEATRWAGASKS
jgi:hypothetical protein